MMPISKKQTVGEMTNRRSFLGSCSAGAAAALMGSSARAGRGAAVSAIEHIKLHGDRTTYCGHPRQCGIFNFGKGEIAVGHNHAPCAYQKPTDIQHDFGGYHSR